MNENFVSRSDLEKNIEKINFYAGEERKNLNLVLKKLEECCDNYKSNNTSKLANNFSKLKKDINKIYLKRMKYSDILNKVLISYNNSERRTQQIFSSNDN